MANDEVKELVEIAVESLRISAEIAKLQNRVLELSTHFGDLADMKLLDQVKQEGLELMRQQVRNNERMTEYMKKEEGRI